MHLGMLLDGLYFSLWFTWACRSVEADTLWFFFRHGCWLCFPICWVWNMGVLTCAYLHITVPGWSVEVVGLLTGRGTRVLRSDSRQGVGGSGQLPFNHPNEKDEKLELSPKLLALAARSMIQREKHQGLPWGVYSLDYKVWLCNILY